MNGCARTAWLELSGYPNLYLEDVTQGYFCSSLDLGYPVVRDVVDNRPDQDGFDDRTQYMGARTITATIDALTGAGARIDAVATLFAPYMVPSARPVLHYVLDRPGVAERTIVMRAANYDWPIAGGDQREVALQWIGHPIARDPALQSAVAFAGASTGVGRTYPLTFNRVYPTGGGSASTGRISSLADQPIRPVFTIYGPITNPQITSSIAVPGGGGYGQGIYTVAGYSIAAGHFLQIDTATKTVLYDGDPAQPQGSALDWSRTAFPVYPTGGLVSFFYLTGQTTTGVSQAVATWHDGYLV
jgi:hypothetical protein